MSTTVEVSRADAEAYVGELAAAAGLPAVAVTWVDGDDGAAYTRDGRHEIVLGRDTLRHPGRLRFTVAHEIGHLALGHTDTALARRGAVAYAAEALALTAGLLLVAVALPVLALAVPVALLGHLHAMLRTRLWPRELAADRYAADAGAPITLAGQPYDGSRFVHALFPSHPGWDARRRATAHA
ncbi:M48 family metalloprotease [Luteipulveratus sp. YIM 133132]|uniref:ImmA/IrrE family metallo-endopeptidase n=1 Tax=Luteipulveratus flavus TaxID=3031728 RepID=UPI0023AFDD94|nr:M48 family metalloprotease [Luteipulveratus sp. YIM 133132]MDE9366883.1 M48 family metalloprotease [Luteipulveratus sp. YIM 133132]